MSSTRSNNSNSSSRRKQSVENWPIQFFPKQLSFPQRIFTVISGQYLRSKATPPASRSIASKTVGRTIGRRNYRHSVTTVDWLSVHLSHGVNFKLKVAWTGRPAWRSHHCSRTGIKLTSRWFTVQPVLHVGTRRIGWSQSNHITTVDNGISMALKGKKTINQSIRWSTFLVKLRGEGEFEDYNNTFHFAVRQYWLIQLIVAGSRLRKFNIFE